MLHVMTWLWGDKYKPTDVSKLHGGLFRNLKQEFRFICVTDQWHHQPSTMEHCDYGPMDMYEINPKDMHLVTRKGCFARLRMFDPSWQELIGIQDGDRLVCVDLDVVITGNLDPVFDRYAPFVILQGANAANPCPYNGSLMMLRPGAHPEVWYNFNMAEAEKVPFYEFPDDQGWLAHKVPGAAGWKAGEGGIYAFQKPGWPAGKALPADARIVVFPGWRSPAKFKDLPWIKEHWRNGE